MLRHFSFILSSVALQTVLPEKGKDRIEFVRKTFFDQTGFIILFLLQALFISLAKAFDLYTAFFITIALILAAFIYVNQNSMRKLSVGASICAFIYMLVVLRNAQSEVNSDSRWRVEGLFGVISVVVVLLLSLKNSLQYQDLKKDIARRERELFQKSTLIKYEKSGLKGANKELFSQNINLTKLVDDKNRQFQTFLEAINVNIPLSITNAEGLIVEVNKPFCELCKYTEQELIGKNHNIINSGEHSDGFFANFWNKISSGKKWKGELKNIAKDGSVYWVDIVVIPLLNADGEIEKFISLQFSITDTKEAQAQKDSYIASLEEMAFITSHKIRKPVANIMGIVQVVEQSELTLADLQNIKEYLNISALELNDFTFELNNFIYSQIQAKANLSALDASIKNK